MGQSVKPVWKFGPPDMLQIVLFLDSSDQDKNLKFLIFNFFSDMTGISYINHHSRAPSPLKPNQDREVKIYRGSYL